MIKWIIINQLIEAPLEDTFNWMAHSNNFTKSPWVFSSKWVNTNEYRTGAVRNIYMLAGWYQEQITAFIPNERINYRVLKSFPAVKQDFTEMQFKIVDKGTQVTWIIDIEVQIPILGRMLTTVAGALAGKLYGSILTAGNKDLKPDII